jgi:excisionase family DNA binding protein
MVHRRCESPRSLPETNAHRATRSDVALVYTVAEVAERLKVSPGTVRNMIDRGQLYALRLHVRRIVIPKWSVDELVARPTSIVELARAGRRSHGDM